MVMLKQKAYLFMLRFREAWIACLTCMVKGDFSTLTISHALTAAKTGSIAGVAFVLLSFVKNLKDNKWAIVWSVSVLTMVADYIVHPTHFGTELTEALTTGICAGIIAYFMMKYVDPK